MCDQSLTSEIFQFMHKSHYFNNQCYRNDNSDSLQASLFSEYCIAHFRNWNYCPLKELLGKSPSKSCRAEAAVALGQGSCHLVAWVAHVTSVPSSAPGCVNLLEAKPNRLPCPPIFTFHPFPYVFNNIFPFFTVPRQSNEAGRTKTRYREAAEGSD